MNPCISFNEKSYRKWLRSRDRESLRIEILLREIWRYLCRWPETIGDDEGFWCLVNYTSRATRNQNRYIYDLCGKYGEDYIQSLQERAAHLYVEALKARGSLLEKARSLPGEDFHKYLYQSLKYMLLNCNREWVNALHNPAAIRFITETAETEENSDEVRPQVRGFGDFIVGEYQSLLETKRLALLLGKRLMTEWGPRRLNVLCHYYEKMCGRHSSRLSDESMANIHKLHQHLREDLRQLVSGGICSKRVLEEMLGACMPKICQTTPVLSTYKKTRQDHTEES